MVEFRKTLLCLTSLKISKFSRNSSCFEKTLNSVSHSFFVNTCNSILNIFKEYKYKQDIFMHNFCGRFANSAMKMNDPLQTLFQLMSCRQPAAVTVRINHSSWYLHHVSALHTQSFHYVSPSQKGDILF